MDFSALSGLSISWESIVPTVLVMGVMYLFNWRKNKLDNAHHEKEIGEKEQQIADLKTKVDSTIYGTYDVQMTAMKNSITSLTEENTALRKEVQALKDVNAELRDAIRSLQEEIKDCLHKKKKEGK